MNIHEKYMRLAIDLAKKAEGKTSPNPIVGAVIVKNGKIVGMGYHRKAGLPHAEVNALSEAGSRSRGATLYVTLEPCDHFGRTSPCTDAIIDSGIKKVVMAMRDPNPINNGSGINKLRRNGIRITCGILEEDSRLMNGPYIKYITTGIPYITVKVAQSLDGKIATRTGDSKWISSDDSRRYVHELRGKADAVMVGANTVIKDDPSLLSRIPGAKQPLRIIVAANTKIPSKAKVFSRRGKNQPAIVLKSLSEALAIKNITNILVEGGGELIASLVESDLVDRFLIFVAPKIIGGRDARTPVEGSGAKMIKDAKQFKITDVKRFKNDIMIEAVR